MTEEFNIAWLKEWKLLQCHEKTKATTTGKKIVNDFYIIISDLSLFKK